MNQAATSHSSDHPVPASGTPGWWLMFTRELGEIWIMGRALYLLILFSIFLGIASFLLATVAELDLMPPREMVHLLLQVAIAFGLFIGLIIGADSISGERERATLEGLLLAPISRTHIVAGKFLAGISPWPAAFMITSIYVVVLSQSDPVLGKAILWSAVIGTLLAVAFTGFGMLVSTLSNSNKTSLLVSLMVYLVLLIPTQFPATAQIGPLGQLTKKMNPLDATNHFLERTLVYDRTLDEMWSWLQSPLLFAAIVIILLFLVAAPRLALEVGEFKLGDLLRRRGKTISAAAVLLCCILVAGPALAFQTGSTHLEIAIDTAYVEVRTGDRFTFQSSVTNNGAEASAPLIVAMNIVNVDARGDYVDPEDWSPRRAQYLDSLPPGETSTMTWIINPILAGNYMAYLVVIPEPTGPQVTTQAIASAGLHLTVERFTRLNPAGILPYAIGIPLLLILGTYILLGRKRDDEEDA